MHDRANLTLTTTDQYFIFMMVPIAYLALKHGHEPGSPLPRWCGDMTICIALFFEAGAVAFLPKTGPFAWNGLFVYWVPWGGFGIWIQTSLFVLFRAIRNQDMVNGRI